MATVSFKGASRVYPGTNTPAVDKLDLDISDGEFMVLVGPSGSGKSTALRMLAGLEEVNEGSIYIGDRDVTDRPPRERDIAMVFQNYALYPHLTVADNMGFALQMQGIHKDERAKRVADAAKLLGLEEYLDRKPKALSGGQRQRVAMGRAIVRNPQVFLMDEPLYNLDAKLRVQTRTQIAQLQHRLGVTTVYVTHDQIEAMTMGDRVAVLQDGLLQQVDTPLNLYDRPKNRFVAGFIGSPAMNLIEARIVDVGAQIGDYVVPIAEPAGEGGRRQDADARHPAGGIPSRGRGPAGEGRSDRGARLGGVPLRHSGAHDEPADHRPHRHPLAQRHGHDRSPGPEPGHAPPLLHLDRRAVDRMRKTGTTRRSN